MIRRAYELISRQGISGLMSGVNRYVLTKTKSIRQKFIRYHGISELNHSHVLWLPPDQIRYSNTALSSEQVKITNSIYSGPWDTPIETIEYLPIYISFKEHFEEGAEWEETEYFDYLIERMGEPGKLENITTIEKIEERLRFIDNLYTRIMSEGYKTQIELLRDRPNETIQLNNDAPKPELNEVSVCIARDGTFIRQGAGKHRLFIAKILELDKIPVQVRARHQKWQQKLEQYDQGENPSPEFRDHPDVIDILSG